MKTTATGAHRVTITGFKMPGYRDEPRFGLLRRLPASLRRRLPSWLVTREYGLATPGNGYRPLHTTWSSDFEDDAIIPRVPFVRGNVKDGEDPPSLGDEETG